MAEKPTQINEQLEILSRNKLKMEDEEKAYDFLINHNYYRIKGYLFHFQDSGDNYTTDITFNKIINIYKFDSKFRKIILSLIEQVELSFKSYVALGLANIEPKNGYIHYDRDLIFEQRFASYEKLLNTVESYINGHSGSPVVRRYTKPNGECQLPIWAFVEFLSFGDIISLVSCIKRDKLSFLKDFYLFRGNPWSKLGGLLKSANKLRNICSHHERLYKSVFTETPPPKLRYEEFTIDYPGYTMSQTTLFNYIFSIVLLTPNKKEVRAFTESLINHLEIYKDSIDLCSDYSFPENWKELLEDYAGYLVEFQMDS